MTDDTEKIRQIFQLLDSDQPGEQAAALGKMRALQQKTGKPLIRDFLHRFDQLHEIETERDDLAQRNAALVAQAAASQLSRWAVLKSRALPAGVVAVVMALAGAGFHHQTMTTSKKQFRERLDIAASLLDEEESFARLNAKGSLSAANWRKSVKCVIGEEKFCPPGADSETYAQSFKVIR